MLDAFLSRYLAPRLAPWAARLSRAVSADVLTVTAFVCGAAALPAIGAKKYFLALGLLVLRGALDVLDGAVVRVAGPSRMGAVLDRVLDLVMTAAVPFAFALAQPDRALAAMFLMLGLVARAGAVTSAADGRALIGKSELFVGFALACLFPDRFSIIAYILGILCFVAAGQRVAAVASP
jgi:phosphatidylglycerophosphate synthase